MNSEIELPGSVTVPSHSRFASLCVSLQFSSPSFLARYIFIFLIIYGIQMIFLTGGEKAIINMSKVASTTKSPRLNHLWGFELTKTSTTDEFKNLATVSLKATETFKSVIVACFSESESLLMTKNKRLLIITTVTDDIPDINPKTILSYRSKL